jgi:hypothetical protein
MATTSPTSTITPTPTNDCRLQQSYLTKIDSLQKTQSDEITALQQAQIGFNNINKIFENTNNTNAGLLTDQDKVIDLVNQEYYRLLQKKKNIDDAVYGQERAALLNDSYRMKYIEYTKMLIAFVIVLIIIIALYQFKTMFPPFVIDLSVFVLCTFLLFYCYFVYSNLAARNPLQFEEIQLNPPSVLTTQKPSDSAQNVSNLFSNELNGLGECLGSACCADGTYFDPTTTQCLPGTAPPTTAPATTAAPTGSCSIPGSSTSGEVAPGIYNGGTAVYYTN